MTLTDALNTGDVDRALEVARGMDALVALSEARKVAFAPGADDARAAATTVMARVAVTACPAPGSPATDSAEVIAAKAEARAAFLADQHTTLRRLVDDPAPAVSAAAAIALIEATEDADLDTLRPQLAGAQPALTQLAATDGAAALAVLRLVGGRAAVRWLVELVDGYTPLVPIEALCDAVARAPVPEARAPLETLLAHDPLLAQWPHIVPRPDSPAADRVRGLAKALAAIDRRAVTQVTARATAEVRAIAENGVVDAAVYRLTMASPAALPALRGEFGDLLPMLEARCEAGDARAVPATLRLGGEPLVAQWIAAIADGDTAPAPLDALAADAARLGYQAAAAPLARLVEDASRKAQTSAAWVAMLGHDAAAAVRALRVLDPARANALVAAAPAALRARLEANESARSDRSS